MLTNLNKRQILAAEMLGMGYRSCVVADKLSIRRETLSRWKTLPAFESISQQARINIMTNLISDKIRLLSRSHDAIDEALMSSKTTSISKTNIAIRYLCLLGGSSNAYNKLEEWHAFLLSTNDESNNSFSWVIRVLDELCDLKTSNGYLSDAEYRKKS